MNKAIKLIGIIFSVESGLTKSVSAVGRILVGMLAGLPPTALAVSSMVSFTTSALLEFPTGLLTDLLGKVRMTVIGYYCQAAASSFLFVALIVHRNHPQAMWCFLILEALFDAAGNALASGSLEALFQQIIVSESDRLAPAQAKKLRESGLLQAEAFGRYIAFAAPLVGLSAALYLKYSYDLAQLMLLIHAGGWIVVAEMIRQLAKRYSIQDISMNKISERIIIWKTELIEIFRGRGQAGLSGAIGTLGMFMSSSVEAYYIITVLREIRSEGAIAMWLPALVITFTAAIGQLARSFLLPYLSRRFANISLVIFGLIGQSFLSILMICGAEFTSGRVWTGILILYPALFGLLIGFMIRPTIGMLFTDTKPEVHATVMSLRSAVALLLLGAYSALLSFGSGTPTLSWIMMLNICICVLAMCLLTFRLRINEKFNG